MKRLKKKTRQERVWGKMKRRDKIARRAEMSRRLLWGALHEINRIGHVVLTQKETGKKVLVNRIEAFVAGDQVYVISYAGWADAYGYMWG